MVAMFGMVAYSYVTVQESQQKPKRSEVLPTRTAENGLSYEKLSSVGSATGLNGLDPKANS
jgi:hypothetical protein